MFTTNQDYVIQQQILSYYVVEHLCLLLQSHYNRTLQSPNTTQFKACVLSHSIKLTIGYSCTTGTLVILTFIFVTSELQAVRINTVSWNGTTNWYTSSRLESCNSWSCHKVWEICLGPKYFSNVAGHMPVFMVDWNVLDKLKIAVGIYKAYRLQLVPIHGLWNLL